MENLTIRHLVATDQTAWDPLWQSYLTFYESAVSDAVSKATFAALSDPEITDRCAFIAIWDGKPVGITHLIFHAHNWQLENTCYLQDLFVAPEARGRGIARALIEETYDFADKNGTPRVYWTTKEDNKTARILYDKLAHKTSFIQYLR